jgi:choline dehydrogenase-like flavoprotein
MGAMPRVPESTKSSLAYKLHARARERWPQLSGIEVTHRAGFAYVTGVLPDGQELKLCRLRYGGSASSWGFAIYRASRDDYQPSLLPSGLGAGSPEEALDTACGLYLGDPTAWVTPPKN